MKIFAIIVAVLGFGGLLVVGGWYLYKKLTAVTDAASGAVTAVTEAAGGELAYLKNQYGGEKEAREAEVSAADTKALIQQTHADTEKAALKRETPKNVTIPTEITSDAEYKKKVADWQAARKAEKAAADKKAAADAVESAKLDAVQGDLDAFYQQQAAQKAAASADQTQTTDDTGGLGTWF